MPPLAPAGAGSGGKGDTVGVRRGGAAESMHGAVAPAAMGAAATPLGQ